MQSLKATESVVETSTIVKPFQFRGRFFTAVALHLTGDAGQAFYDAVDAQLSQTPQFFVNAPLVIDLELATGLEKGSEFARLVDALRGRQLSVFGIQNGNARQTAAALEAGLISMPAGGRDVPVERVDRNAGPVPAAPEAAPQALPSPALIITDPVRSGQKIFADRGDLVIVASVGSGAELVAVGNIHVYGQLRGRALAGVNGDATARIFCQSLDAELLAIAGLYRTSEDMGPAIRKQRVQAFLQDEKMYVEKLK